MKQAKNPGFPIYLAGAFAGAMGFPLRALTPLWLDWVVEGKGGSLWGNAESFAYFFVISCSFWCLSGPILVVIGGIMGACLAGLAHAATKSSLTGYAAVGVTVVAGMVVGMLIEGIVSIVFPVSASWSAPTWPQAKTVGTIVLVVLGGVLGLVVSIIQVYYSRN